MDYKNSFDDKFYTFHGKTPPERNPHLTEEELQSILANNLKDHVCEWRQFGTEIRCEVGENIHGKFIKPTERLLETKNGVPILTTY